MYRDILHKNCLQHLLTILIRLSNMILVLTAVLIQQAFAQSSSNYKIKKTVINQGGAASQSANYKVADAVGQSSPVDESNSTHYIIYSGFLGGGIVIITALDELDNANMPLEFKLYQNYPNPFNPSTKIKFALPKVETVTIEIYNIIGQNVKTLVNQSFPAGYHEVEFNGQNLSSGIYLYRIEAGKDQEVKKMVLIK